MQGQAYHNKQVPLILYIINFNMLIIAVLIYFFFFPSWYWIDYKQINMEFSGMSM